MRKEYPKVARPYRWQTEKKRYYMGMRGKSEPLTVGLCRDYSKVEAIGFCLERDYDDNE